MTEHHVHNGPIDKRTANRIAGRWLSRAIITSGLLAAAMIGVIFSPQQSGSAQKASVDLHRGQAIPAAEPVPADVPGAGVTGRP